MLALFRRKTAPPSDAPSATPSLKGSLRPESAAALLATPRRKRLIEHIWQRTSLSRAQFGTLYRAPLERYAALVQQFPASESHHHAYPGGLLDHGLEIVAYALKLRQSYLLPIGAPPETQAAQAEAWTAAAAYAALLHDIGKIAVDLHIEYADGERWYPWHGPLEQPYRLRYRSDRTYRLHSAAAGLLYNTILDRRILDWLSSFPELWASLLYVLAGQSEHAGILGELVQHADQASVAQDLGGDPAKARTAPKHALQRKLLDGLRYLLKEELRLNQPQGASDGWLTHDALWLVSKTVCDKLRAHLLSQGMDGVPQKNSTLFDVLQDHGIAQANTDGKAIWKATVISAGGWTHSFTFLKVAPALIWDADTRPAAFTGSVQADDTATVDPSELATVAASPPPLHTPSPATIPPATAEETDDSVSDVLALLGDPPIGAAQPLEHPMTDAKPLYIREHPRDYPPPAVRGNGTPVNVAGPGDSLGAQFVAWLRSSIQARRLKINEAKALVHTVAGTAFVVTPGVFQRFIQEHPEVARLPRDPKFDDWNWIQKRFEKLRLHKKRNNGLNIWTCEVTGQRKSRQLHGYLLTDAHTLFDDVPFDNPYLKLL